MPALRNAAPALGDTRVSGWSTIQVIEAAVEKEKATEKLAQYLVVLFGGVIALHYIVLLFGRLDKDGRAELANVFNTLLPVISGLIGSAATYYFTRDKK